jgi:Na+-translocating ferredoxin:NAD+ oxidoreductase RnfG subunit
MKYISILLIIFFTLPLNAKMLISPVDVMKQSFGVNSKISKKNILLKNNQAKKIQQDARAKIKSKIFKVFKAEKSGKTLGYGIIVNRKVRSKNAAVLYVISKDSVLKSIEIIAFNEPMEYIPSKTWIKQFENISTDKRLRTGNEIPTITGATLSAKSIVDGSRVAFAFYEEMLKGKK